MCPVCSEPMVSFELEGVEIDRCLTCRGTWLDAGELEMITYLAGSPQEDVAAALETAEDGSRTRRRCPRCPRKLREFIISTAADAEAAGKEIVLDRCPWGHGIWFDRSEMEDVIRSFAGGIRGAVAGFFGDLYHNELESKQEGE